jgi:hypothetical protein
MLIVYVFDVSYRQGVVARNEFAICYSEAAGVELDEGQWEAAGHLLGMEACECTM